MNPLSLRIFTLLGLGFFFLFGRQGPSHGDAPPSSTSRPSPPPELSSPAPASTPAPASASRPSSPPSPSVAITLDDPEVQPSPRMSPLQRDTAILRALSDARLQAALFVCGKRVDHPQGKALLHRWQKAGHWLANHSYSHWFLHARSLSLERYLQDIQRGDDLLTPFSGFRKFFRYPFLKEGSTLQKRDGVRAWLKAKGYRIGHVTIDASDWYTDQRLRRKLRADPKVDLRPYRDFYLEHIWDRAVFYERLASVLTGRRIKHTLLLHHNLLNALFLGDLLRMFQRKGWMLVDVDSAFEDPIYRASPAILPAGESLLWALAKESGRFSTLLRYPAEDGRYEKPAMDNKGL